MSGSGTCKGCCIIGSCSIHSSACTRALIAGVVYSRGSGCCWSRGWSSGCCGREDCWCCPSDRSGSAWGWIRRWRARNIRSVYGKLECRARRRMYRRPWRPGGVSHARRRQLRYRPVCAARRECTAAANKGCAGSKDSVCSSGGCHCAISSRCSVYRRS